MALFPPAPPLPYHNGPTSGFFQREERAFFAQAGKEIVRVRIEVDLKEGGELDSPAKPRSREGTTLSVPRPYSSTNASSHPQLHPPPQLSPNDIHPSPYPPTHAGRAPRAAPVTVTTQPVFPIPSHTSPQAPYPPNVHPSPNPQHAGFPLRAPEHERLHHPADGGEALPEEFRDDPEEAWRRPTPHSQRRRAGKHTRRVVVK